MPILRRLGDSYLAKDSFVVIKLKSAVRHNKTRKIDLLLSDCKVSSLFVIVVRRPWRLRSVQRDTGKGKRGTRTDIYMVIEGKEERMRKGKKERKERKG